MLLRSGRKRAIDLILASTAAVVFAPLFLVISAAIILESGWPPIFAQERVGLHGRRFRIRKFRTMTLGAEAQRQDLAAFNEAPFPFFKLRADPRVTTIGRALRRASLDELPQVWNVLRGEMSLVGPRPALPEEVAHVEASALERLEVRPGITCTWQIECRRRSDVSFAERVRLDLEYLERWSLLGDVRIILRTLAVIGRLSGT